MAAGFTAETYADTVALHTKPRSNDIEDMTVSFAKEAKKKAKAKKTKKPFKRAAKKLTIDEVKFRAAFAEKKTGSQVAKEFGISVPTVNNYKKRWGISTPRKK